MGKNSRGGEVAEQPRRRETGLAEIGEANAALDGAGQLAQAGHPATRRRRR